MALRQEHTLSHTGKANQGHLKFSILSKDIFTCRLGELGIDSPTLWTNLSSATTAKQFTLAVHQCCCGLAAAACQPEIWSVVFYYCLTRFSTKNDNESDLLVIK